VKLIPLLATPPTVTTTFPVVAPVGTCTTIWVSLQLVGVAEVPLNVIELVPCAAPKLVPTTVTAVPTGPKVGLKLEIVGDPTVTVNVTPLLGTPPTATITFPVVAPTGTGATICASFQLVVLATTPLNESELALVPTVGPKFDPFTATTVPMGPDVGLILMMLGGGVTVKGSPLLACPATVTSTFPVVAPPGTTVSMLVSLQLIGTAGVPLNVTLLVPWVAPRFMPEMVIAAPTGP
jgi:hypothetical protein